MIVLLSIDLYESWSSEKCSVKYIENINDQRLMIMETVAKPEKWESHYILKETDVQSEKIL